MYITCSYELLGKGHVTLMSNMIFITIRTMHKDRMIDCEQDPVTADWVGWMLAEVPANQVLQPHGPGSWPLAMQIAALPHSRDHVTRLLVTFEVLPLASRVQLPLFSPSSTTQSKARRGSGCDLLAIAQSNCKPLVGIAQTRFCARNQFITRPYATRYAFVHHPLEARLAARVASHTELIFIKPWLSPQRIAHSSVFSFLCRNGRKNPRTHSRRRNASCC